MKKILLFLLVSTSFQVLGLSLKDLGRVNYDKADNQTQVDMEDRIYKQIMREKMISNSAPGQVRIEEANKDVKANLN